VQLLGNVIALKTAAAAGSGAAAGWTGGSNRGDGCHDSGKHPSIEGLQSRSFTTLLLEGVVSALKAACRASAAAAAAEALPAVDVVVGSAAASAAAEHDTAPAAPKPAATVSVAAPAGVALRWCSLACLTAGRQQQLALHLQLGGGDQAATAAAAAAAAAGGGGGSDTCCRVLCFTGSGVLLDEQAQLQQVTR
jgi:hypothetical protein